MRYCLPPDVLEEAKKKLEEYEAKHQKVDKKAEYLKQKKRKDEIYGQRTKKGQPVMAGRMELLYEQIKKTTGSE